MQQSDIFEQFSLAGKVACVTGASSGLGQRAADALIDAGAQVVAVARNKNALVNWASGHGAHADFVVSDIADNTVFDATVQSITEKFGAPDILINAAGLNPRLPADALTRESWDQTLDVNLKAPFFLAQAFAKGMKEKGWGRIVNFASLQSFRAFPAGLSYGASKGGVAQLTRAMAEAWSADGINANAIAPGFFPTELTAAVFNDTERANRNAAQTCIGRNGDMEDLDGPIVFLCSDASRYITGQVIMLDGGFTAK